MTEVIKEPILLKHISNDLGLHNGTVIVYCNNQSIIHLAKNHVFHEKSKHIDVSLHFVRDVVAAGEIKLEKISIKENPLDMFTIALLAAKFRHCLNLISMENC